MTIGQGECGDPHRSLSYLQPYMHTYRCAVHHHGRHALVTHDEHIGAVGFWSLRQRKLAGVAGQLPGTYKHICKVNSKLSDLSAEAAILHVEPGSGLVVGWEGGGGSRRRPASV